MSPLSTHLAMPAPYDFFEFVGQSAVMQRLYALIAASAADHAPVFISGETGTGKDVTARALHALSPRRTRPFVTVNCAALPRDLIESELFGHRRGAFTGALADQAGAFARADGGCLFLDEVSEMPPALQAKLLRAVETGSYAPLGAGQEYRADVRVIAASNRPPQQALADGYLRADLYYRLAGIELQLPPLRARGAADIERLCHYYLARLCPPQIYAQGAPALSEAARAWLCAHPWPGNLRQLENTLRQAVVLHRPAVIEPQHLPERDREAAADAPLETLAAQESRLIAQAIAQHGGNLTAAARALGIDVSTLHRRKKRPV